MKIGFEIAHLFSRFGMIDVDLKATFETAKIVNDRKVEKMLTDLKVGT